MSSLLAPSDFEVREVVVLSAKTPAGEVILGEHGDRWLVCEVDRSVLSRNLGLHLVPESYLGTKHLMPRYDRRDMVAIRYGFSRWVHPRSDADLEVAKVPEIRSWLRRARRA